MHEPVQKNEAYHMLRVIGVIFTGFGVFGCTEVIPPSAGDSAGRQSAFFASFPEPLFAGARASCQEPGDTLTMPSPQIVRCETLPPPDVAGALILRFNGDLNALPTLINTLSATPTQAGNARGFVVMADYFVAVPQKDGSRITIRLEDDRIQRSIRRAFTANGGQAIPAP